MQVPVRPRQNRQNNYVNQIDPLVHLDTPLFRDTVQISRVYLEKYKKVLKKDAQLCLYGDRITLDGMDYPFAKADAITLLGKNKLNLYWDQEIFQIKGNKRFNALKYLNFYHRYKNITEGDTHGKFLGL